jgi:hypothetical protein
VSNKNYQASSSTKDIYKIDSFSDQKKQTQNNYNTDYNYGISSIRTNPSNLNVSL